MVGTPSNTKEFQKGTHQLLSKRLPTTVRGYEGTRHARTRGALLILVKPTASTTLVRRKLRCKSQDFAGMSGFTILRSEIESPSFYAGSPRRQPARQASRVAREKVGTQPSCGGMTQLADHSEGTTL